MSRPLPIDRYGLIYACAQKNAGPSGVTVVIARDDLIRQAPENLPPMLDYRQYADNESRYNTPPTFGIYVVMLICRWLKNEIGGLGEDARTESQQRRRCYTTCWTSIRSFIRGMRSPIAAR